MDYANHLEKINKVIADGPYSDTWESLCGYPEAEWYKNAKLGIFIHWGLYSVPAYYSEWYSRAMYQQGNPAYEHHLKTYGKHKDFGYKDFIPMFKAEKFDPEKWAELFKASGAKFVMPVAEHHDGFQMYDSELCKYNARQMGPCRDVLSELKAEIEKNGMAFTASSHRAEHYWFFDGGLEFDSDINDPEWIDFYGVNGSPVQKGPLEHFDFSDAQIPAGVLEDWLVRTCEIVDRYEPKIMFFDWWINAYPYKDYLAKFAAYYYNKAAKAGYQAAINYKYDAFAYSSAVFDMERGVLKDIQPRMWQCDTAIGKISWGYTDANEYKEPHDILCDFADIISKNGCLLINVGPKSDGTITGEETSALLEIGKWMDINSEAVYGTTFWKVYGEGPVKIMEEGHFTDTKRGQYTSGDIRFTYKDGFLYVFALNCLDSDTVSVKTLGKSSGRFTGRIDGVKCLDKSVHVSFTRDGDALNIKLDRKITHKNPVVFKVSMI